MKDVRSLGQWEKEIEDISEPESFDWSETYTVDGHGETD